MGCLSKKGQWLELTNILMCIHTVDHCCIRTNHGVELLAPHALQASVGNII